MKQQLATDQEQLGNYQLTRLLGQGGSATVYLAKHIYLDTKAAIKVLNTHLTRDEIRSFHLEARLLASLRHRHIVRVLDLGVEEHTPFWSWTMHLMAPCASTFPQVDHCRCKPSFPT